MVSCNPPKTRGRGRRYRQYQASRDRRFLLKHAQRLVADKLESHVSALRDLQRRAAAGQSTSDCMQRIRELKRKAGTAESHDELRGLEGTGTRTWYQAFAESLPEAWSFPGRRKRPPTDPVNALLSLGYTMLFHRVEAAVQAWGLDPALGLPT